MDAPQWYNSRLWNTSKQSIDGKPFIPPSRPKSANVSSYKSGFNIQPLTGNWSNFIKGQNLNPSNHDQSFTYKYTNPYRQIKSGNNKLSNSFSTRYFNSLTPNFNFNMKSNDRINSAQMFTIKSKPSNTNETATIFHNSRNLLKSYTQNKVILTPNTVSYDQDLTSLPTKQEIVHGNINIESSPRINDDDAEDENSDNEIAKSISDNITVTRSQSFQNTARNFDISSQYRQPQKSILKKSPSDVSQSNIPTFTIYNNFYPSRVRTIGVSSKPLISPQINIYSDIRKSMQSAPGTKREVRFDMTNNNIIEYSPHE